MNIEGNNITFEVYKSHFNNDSFNQEDDYLIFDMKQAKYIRENKSFGRFIGSISNQKNVDEVDDKTNNYLPLKLNKFEIGLLIENSSTSESVLIRENNELRLEKINEFNEKRDKYNKDLNILKINEYIKTRKSQLISMRDKILASKKKKLNAQLARLTDDQERLKVEETIRNLETDFDNELSNLEAGLNKEYDKKSESNENTEIFMQSPEFYQYLFPTINVSRSELNIFISTLNKTCKYNAFKHLYNEGFFLTSGAKFGGDFLVYPGKPSKYHSQFILVCNEGPGKLTFNDLVVYSRMATTVKKTFVMALFIEKETYLKNYVQNNQYTNKVIVFTSINWAHF